ncbi:MAG: N-6 DNA methylase, partial [Deltaproteobacteria bacterium]|nr:N-6 DNA methylase [Deltaproteobacteria bacterium]
MVISNVLLPSATFTPDAWSSRMPPLTKPVRNRLEAAVTSAREKAEAGARSVLDYLGVAEASTPPYLDEGQRGLGDRLRLHGQQLGDHLKGDTPWTMDRLVEETAYEHWNRMLFARFLEAKDMLIYRSSGGPIPVTLEDCESLAPLEKAEDGQEFAARCAALMLPGIFRAGSPALELVLPPESRQDLAKIIADLPPEVFVADDSLGWCYQHYQALRKNAINASEVKIGERELPSVTQLFSEPYMVAFLLDNTLGAWRAARCLPESALASAATEGELRRLAGLPGVPLAWLRLVRDGEGPWAPAAGTFARWPDNLADFRMLDPCCGSGHFLVAAFNMLVPMRMADERLSAREAVNAVLSENIHGLELDRRCAEIAAFALAMAAWTYPDAGGYRELPPLNVACSGIAVGAKKENWTALACGDSAQEETLAGLYDAFRLAPVLGSLLDPQAGANGIGLLNAEWETGLLNTKWEIVRPLLDRALAAESYTELTESAVAAKGIADAASLLSRQYTMIATNVPYLSAGKHHATLKDFCRKHYPEAKSDLATVFIDRCLKLCPDGGTVAAVTPQNWLSLTSYTKFRERLLVTKAWQMLARLGPGAFETISGEVVKAILIIISRGFEAGQTISCIDVSDQRLAAAKSKALADSEVARVAQARQLDNPDKRVSAEELGTGELLEKISSCHNGITTGDAPRMRLFFWEFAEPDRRWIRFQGTSRQTMHFDGNSYMLRWEGGSGTIDELVGAFK